jgi:hypothetical protein
MFRLLASLPREYLITGGIATLVVVWFLGLIAHAVLRDRGFGVIGNGALIIVGAAAGIYAGSLFVGPIYPR